MTSIIFGRHAADASDAEDVYLPRRLAKTTGSSLPLSLPASSSIRVVPNADILGSPHRVLTSPLATVTSHDLAAEAQRMATEIARDLFGSTAWARFGDADHESGKATLEVHYGIGGDRELTAGEYALHDEFVRRWTTDVDRETRRSVALEWFTV